MKRAVSAALLAMALMAAGCGGTHHVHAGAATRSSENPSTPVSPPAPAARTCAVRLPKTIATSLHAPWARPHPDQIEPFTSTAAGDWDFAQIHASGFYGVGLVDLTTGKTKQIAPFSKAQFQALGAYDGRVAVWKEFHSLNGLDAFSVKEWDRATGKIYTVGHSYTDPTTHAAYPSPWVEPVLGDGYASWVASTSEDGAGHLVVLDTGTRRERLFSTGHPGGGTLIYGGDLVWGESTKPGALTRFFAKDLATGARVAPPPALAQARGAGSFAVDGKGIAWTGSNDTSLYYSPDGTTPGRLLVHYSVGGFNPPTVLRDGVIVTGFGGGILAATGNGVRTTVVHGGGSVVGVGTKFAVGQPPPHKSATYAEGIALLSPDQFSGLSCGH